MYLSSTLRSFAAGESGAVTVDWVVLTAGVVSLGLATMTVVSAGVEDVSGDTGDALTELHMRKFFHFYLNTVDRKWAYAYLNQEFFQLLRERMADNIVLVMAQDTNDYVAGALNLRGPTTLWGRNWGCTESFRMLYFEACFYRGIEFAIQNRLSKVEAGAQGPHKVSRGYLPSRTYSCHWIRDENFRHAVADFVGRERLGVNEEMETLSQLSPFKRRDSDT